MSPSRTPIPALLGVCCHLVLLASCGDGDPEAPTGSGYRHIDTWGRSDLRVVTALLVVDGSNDEQGAALREELATAVKESGWYPVYCRPTDPMWGENFRETRTVIAFSGAEGAAGYVTSVQLPALTIRADKLPSNGLGAWSEAVSDALLSYVPDERGGAQVLQTYQDAAKLLLGTAEPATTSEKDVVSGWDPANVVEAYIATAHEDTSSGTVEFYAPDIEDAEHEAWVGWLVGPGDISRPCYTLQPGRLAEFEAASLVDRVRGWNGRGECPLLERPLTCRQRRCIDADIPVNADGSTECRVFFAASGDDGACSEEEGWRELDDSLLSLEVRAAWPDRTVCEVVQLRGAAMAACQSDLKCVGCEPGFCLTEVEEIGSDCTSVARQVLPRTINPARVGMYDMYCPTR